MKLRIRGNAIRLRLTRGEVERIAAGEAVEEVTQLADKLSFRYSLGPSSGSSLQATMCGTHLAVTAPAASLASWANSDEVALACPVAEGGADILIEKDFACLAPRDGSDDDDTFPHPSSGQRSC